MAADLQRVADLLGDGNLNHETARRAIEVIVLAEQEHDADERRWMLVETLLTYDDLLHLAKSYVALNRALREATNATP